MDMKEYIKSWREQEGVKEKNNPEFIASFTEYIDEIDLDCWSFQGENGYCGYTAYVYSCNRSYRYGKSTLDFELAYSKDFVKVFDAGNEGFWVPEYIDLKGREASKILSIVKSKLADWAGF